MTQVTITVRGEHTSRHQPERAVVHATVRHEGPERDPVLAATLTAADAVRTLIEPLVDEGAGPVTRWSSESVRVWSQRPWNQDGAQLPPVHYAEQAFTVEFSDFGALAGWVEATVRVDGVVIHHISWELTDETRAVVTAQTRTRAIADAVEKASGYAAAVGLPTPVPIALADPGMLGDRPGSDGGGSMPGMAMRAAKFDGGGGAPELDLRPEELTVSCTVDARFLAG